MPTGLVLHLVGDVIPHRDIVNRRFEVQSGVLCATLVLWRRGSRDPATIGALAASAPDIEHVWRLPRPGGRKLFPSHRWRGLHTSGGVRASIQLLVAGVLLGLVLAPPRR